MKLWIILDIDHGCHTFMNMLIYVVILSISWPVLCIMLLRTIVLTWIQIVHLFYHIYFYDLPIGWWNYPDGMIFFVFHLILTKLMFCIWQIIHEQWGPYCGLWNGRWLEGIIIVWWRKSAIWTEVQRTICYMIINRHISSSVNTIGKKIGKKHWKESGSLYYIGLAQVQ